MPPSGPPLPKQGQRVDLWFSGYDDYYPGSVTSVSPPDAFRVTLDDGSSWPVDRINNIWKLTEATPASKKPSTAASPAASPSTRPTPSRKRHTGKALRKSTAATPRVGLGARPASAPAIATPAPVSRGGGGARRSTRSRGDSSNTNTATANHLGRAAARTRARAGVDEGEGAEADEEDEEEEAAVTRRGANGDVARGARGGGARRMKRRRVGEAEEAAAGGGPLSTQAVTAIAVDAALASARAVLRPLGDKLSKVGEEMAAVNDGVREAYEELVKASEGRAAVAGGARVGGVMAEGAVSQAALDALLLDLSELIGGGEARIRAYEQMSDLEIEAFRKALKDNAKAMQQLDKVLGEKRGAAGAAGAGAAAGRNGAKAGRRTRRG
eukprot:GFKZ01000104.1.p1 GENE.GFKZ01000104.1~~GFKZ01000104.1.p1  ORF type:complete len:412 (-),score=74.03 GFKZ01000104.1:273-1421(-)